MFEHFRKMSQRFFFETCDHFFIKFHKHFFEWHESYIFLIYATFLPCINFFLTHDDHIFGMCELFVMVQTYFGMLSTYFKSYVKIIFIMHEPLLNMR